ncbi:hypothetical protein [Pelagibius sp. Alg239-R121]|uniref:hypothetical protein n=1 Tax=Pelagibius sp. Alg239-R121 TaxID=2993448 RepID=UPI0024A7195E|nr:hypothetical protein [Pelagibius sp. Alg239-R121]
MPHEKTMNRLKIASAIVIVFGIAMVSAAIPATSASTAFLLDLIFWPLDGQQSAARPEVHLLFAISGGMLMGWGLLLWQITARLFPRDPDLARSLILTSIGTWFVFDSLGSVVAGAPLNAVFNIGFLLLYVVPLWRTARPAHG